MQDYTIRRLLQLIPVILSVTVIIFLMLHLIPGDPAEILAGEEATMEDIHAIREQLGLDKPLIVQYFTYMKNIARGDLGRSMRTRRPVLQEIMDRYLNTVWLAAWSVVFMIIMGVTTGILSAIKQYSWLDNISMIVALFGVSMPVFWLGLMLMLIFAVHLGLFPTTGIGSFKHLVLPAVTLGASATAVVARLTRSSMLEVIRQDYIRTARAKGLNEFLVIMRHALKNAMIPVVTIVFLRFGALLGGAVLTETVFAWPGIGWLMIDAIWSRDYPVVQGCILMVAVSFVLINLFTDLLYAFIDPRIRYQ
ncbi:MAG: ABC transporter permease [Deltaproteobacteria bacterium]|nr:ABC transporter permease [Deltaproteobacteria bacterium]MBW2305558.1 ABC transporter permease [Deltaproteobacteria bacterium]